MESVHKNPGGLSNQQIAAKLDKDDIVRMFRLMKSVVKEREDDGGDLDGEAGECASFLVQRCGFHWCEGCEQRIVEYEGLCQECFDKHDAKLEQIAERKPWAVCRY